MSSKNKWTTLLLCVFFGYFGIHKFYEGKIGMGLLYLFTFGLFGFGWLIDIIQIATRKETENTFTGNVNSFKPPENFISKEFIGNAKTKQGNLPLYVTSQSSHSNLAQQYNKIRSEDARKGVTYEKQSKIVNLFSRKWFEVCSKEFVVLDFETTGLDKVYDKIIEIAAIRFVDGRETEKYVTLVNPQRPIPGEASAVNHITNSMVSSAPVEAFAIPRLVEFLGDSLIVGHNVNFDIGFLEIAAQRNGMNVRYNYIDTISVSKKLFPQLENYKLGTIAKLLNTDTSKLHRAEADVYVCAEIISIALDSLSADFEGALSAIKSTPKTPKEKSVPKVYTEEYKALTQQAFIRDGNQRRRNGDTLVLVSKHNTSCEICQQFEQKVLIDDVYSGGKKSDGNYMLLSTAIKCGFLHEGCRHGMCTYIQDTDDSSIVRNDYGFYNNIFLSER